MPTIGNPATAIAPRRIVGRQNQKRMHLLDDFGPKAATTFCGQSIRHPAKLATAYNAAQITCDECLVAAISRGGAR